MSIDAALSRAGAKPAGKRPYFMAQEVERALAIAMATVQELAVARQRIDTLERLLESKGLLRRSEIDAFAPSDTEYAERALWTQEYLSRVLRVVQQEGEAIAMDASGDLLSEDVAREVASDD